MKVHIVFFAAARELAGRDQFELELPENATVSDVRKTLESAFPNLAALLGRSMIAVNQEYKSDDSPIADGSEIACIPPVSGGDRSPTLPNP